MHKYLARFGKFGVLDTNQQILTNADFERLGAVHNDQDMFAFVVQQLAAQLLLPDIL